MKVGLFGGAFSPPHIGHRDLITKSVLSEVVDIGLEQVWVMPCYAHAYDKQMVAPEHRLEMCRLMWDDPYVVISDFEIKNKTAGRMFDTVQDLKKQFGHEFYMIVAMDNAESIDQWYRGEELIKTIPFIVSPRAGVMQTHTWYQQAPHRVLSVVPEDCSSTRIRNMLQQYWESGAHEGALYHFLELDVFNYIKENNLYKSK